MPNDKIDSLTLPNSGGTTTTYDIDLPTDATPSISSLTVSGTITEGGTALNQKYAPISHASANSTYGLGTTANYGHVKIQSGDLNGTTDTSGIAAGLGHTHGQYLTSSALTNVAYTNAANVFSANQTLGTHQLILNELSVWETTPHSGFKISHSPSGTSLIFYVEDETISWGGKTFYLPEASGILATLDDLPVINYPVTDVQINGSSVLDGTVAKIETNGVYNATTNKIATMDDLPNVSLTTTTGSEAITVESDTLNVVTRDTTQAISGAKTFTNLNGIMLGDSNHRIAKRTDSNVIDFFANNTTTLTLGSSTSAFYSNVRSAYDNSKDLGASSFRWHDLYLGNNLTDGTNSIKVSEIAKSSDIHDGTLTIQANGTTKGTFTANQSGNTTINIQASDLGLSGAMSFLGVSTTALSDGSTTNPIVVDGSSVTAGAGDVALYGNKEYVWTGSSWEELGNEGSFALKDITVTGTGVLGGGGDLTQNRTITHNEVLGTAQSTAKVFKTTIDKYGHISSATEATPSDIGAASTSDLNNYVKLTTDQTVNGTKTFTSRPKAVEVYTKLAYIQSNAGSGFPYIRTGVLRNVNYVNKLTCVLDGYFVASQTYGFCGYDSGGQLGQKSGKWSTENDGLGTSNINCIGSSNRAVVTQVLDFINNNNKLYISDTMVAGRNINNAAFYSQSDYPLFVAYNGTYTYNPANMVLYSFKMYNGDPSTGTLIRDFIPVKNSANEIGLLDLVEGKFYRNQGTNSFVAGSEVETIQVGGNLLASSDVSIVALTNDYNDLDNKPTIPTNTSQLTNDSGYLTSSDLTNVAYVNVDNNFSASQTMAGADVSGGTLKVNVLHAKTSSSSTTYGPGSSLQVLKSNGTNCYWGSDSNNTTDQGIGGSTYYKWKDQMAGYQIGIAGKDNKLVPMVSGASGTASTGTSKTMNTTTFNPFGLIVYTSSSSYRAADADCSGSTWTAYSSFDLRYSFNCGSTLTAKMPVYIVAEMQSDGQAKLASPYYTQTLPSTADGKIYIYLGQAISTTNINLQEQHPVYQYMNGAIRLFTRDDVVLVSRTINGKALSSDITLTASDVGALPSNTTYVASVKTLDTTATTAQSTNASETINGTGSIVLHKVSKTGSYSDLLGTPDLSNVAYKNINNNFSAYQTMPGLSVKSGDNLYLEIASPSSSTPAVLYVHKSISTVYALQLPDKSGTVAVTDQLPQVKRYI